MLNIPPILKEEVAGDAIEAAACSCISAAFLAKSLNDAPHIVPVSFLAQSYLYESNITITSDSTRVTNT